MGQAARQGAGPFRHRKRSRHADAVVTGAGSGIGAAFARELAARGGRVVCSDIDETAAGATAEAIVADGGRATALRCDVSQIEDVSHLADAAQAWFDGPPSLVVNNAGVGAGGQPIGDTSIDDWNWVLGINLWGPTHGCHVFAPILRAAGTGQPRGIINVASAAAFGAAPGMAAYNVSKAGTLSLSETLAAELSGTGINVTVLCPTFVKTNIVTSGRITEQSTQLADRLMRWTGFSPERVARMCLDTNDRGGLYCMPQPDARIGWGIKRLTPTVYTRAVGLTTRITSSEEVS
ncbi:MULTISPECIES: SDR family oxidoreductase [unclassified Mycolicibacterium]|uniref:SDR family NAD(P)-dependent oxidoreductase n=1 Tax=unclassified Mycolicibacterium TaxID=2636767 RepID=UPI0012DC3F91|nr:MULTISPECIES: SDR family NAD(P)-dependent oxidoreductase [unclassified Mycolicibacterium]MUL81217.1 SDR family NAD(P)-dependent oxidoreductase [Mycolicibacterium sp. CBMA 329]MUL86983.1 SDR family NAD(P)-dependent oxidoreductase [Mycolicibacterium sp. CBMA 331]MUL98734.1 SDR family NAD(P)-dependent oxidoreductase [Mycolicibacterium sp. CBMA 334]MUM25596.1 SDR family NAD(P)-dependent oxidoreductase [Mycolicibacterium sp. CBMA 295]MUM37280.1 SDR family NAD(P)-dependent oxidoreductase [Mycolic